MKTRKHLFINGLSVETVSERIDDYKDYLLCFKNTAKNSEDKMFYWCSKSEYLSTKLVVSFITAGPIESGKIKPLELKLGKTQIIQSEREEFIFEKNN